MKKIILMGLIVFCLLYTGCGDQYAGLGKKLFEDGKHTIYFNNGKMVYRNGDSGKKEWIKIPEKRIKVVEKIENKRSGETPLVGVSIKKGLRMKGQNSFYLFQVEPDFKLLAAYPVPVTQKDRVIIDKSDNLLFFYQKGEIVKVYGVATGEKPHYTPEGVFQIVNKTKAPPERAKDAQLGIRWMGLSVPYKNDQRVKAPDTRSPKGLKYGIHGTNEPESIGKHASGGCVRMTNEDVTEFYELVQVGTTVEIRK